AENVEAARAAVDRLGEDGVAQLGGGHDRRQAANLGANLAVGVEGGPAFVAAGQMREQGLTLGGIEITVDVGRDQFPVVLRIVAGPTFVHRRVLMLDRRLADYLPVDLPELFT